VAVAVGLEMVPTAGTLGLQQQAWPGGVLLAHRRAWCSGVFLGPQRDSGQH